MGNVATMIILIYYVQSEMTAFIFAALPEAMKTSIWLTACLTHQTNMMVYCTMNVSFTIQLHALIPGALI